MLKLNEAFVWLHYIYKFKKTHRAPLEAESTGKS